ncbi:MAG: hypothetical protein ACRD3V_00600, partial [Vicinamibacteria bacterium]
MDALKVHVGVELVVNAKGQPLPLRDLWIRFPLPDGVSIDRAPVLPFVGEETVSINGFLIRRRRGESKEECAALGEMLEDAEPLSEVGAVT